MCGSEHNRVMHKLSRYEHPRNRLEKMGDKAICRFSSIKGSYNTTYIEGGTGIITWGKACSHTIAADEDIHGLGRWNWITLQGKKDRKVTIISVYRPVNAQAAAEYQYKKTCVDRPNKTNEGQESLWYEDLRKMIEKFKHKEHEIIVCGDFNNDLNNEEGEVNRFMDSMGLREVLIQRYGKGPPTHVNGSTTIDGVFATEGIRIRQGGYIDEEFTPSDHKWIWIDIEEKYFLQIDRDDCLPAVTRRATSKIPSIRNKFMELLEEQVQQHKLLDKIRMIHEGGLEKGYLSDDEIKIYEAVEERIQRAVKYADKRCRKVRRGQIPFSKKVQQIMRDIRILKLFKQRMERKGKKGRPRMRKLKRLIKKYKYEGRQNFDSLDQVNNELKIKQTEYHHLKPSANELHKKHLYDIALEKADEDPNGKDVEWHMQKIEREIEMKEHFENIKKFEGKAGRKGVERVDIEVDEDVLVSIYGREEIAESIKEANVEKRLQSRDTPLRTEPLRSLLGEQMDFETWEKILNCEIELPEDGIEEGTRLWYDFVRAQDTEGFIIEWTTEEYCESWRKMGENKSSIPGIHTTHLKCLDPTKEAAEVISKLALIPLQTGYTPMRWKHGIDSMIPKKVEGECRPNKLRLILLFDARFNHNNKLIGRKMMEYAEKKGILATEQYGSRKSKSAIEHAVNKRITLDISRQQKATCVYIANDAKSCYDRILLMVAYLTMRTAGIDAKAALSSIKTLVEMEMSIKTAHGVTEIKYGGDNWEEWPHGIGQGNGYGPAIWALISSPLLKILRNKGHGMNIHSPITKETLKLAGFSFVDDTDQCEMDMTNMRWADHLEKTQASLKLWECLLRTTGGAIEPTKSDWTKLKYKWVDGKAELEEMNCDERLMVRNPEGIEEPLKQYPVHKARETLGVWQASNGQEETQKEKMIEKIEKWGSKIGKSRINGRETATASKITIGKTIRYPLAATTLSKEQAKEIDKVFRWNALGKMKVVRTAPALIAAAPKEYGGMDLGNEIYINQLIDHCLVLLKHGHKATPTGTLLRTTTELLAVEGGMGGDPLLFNTEEMTWITERTWIGETIRALHTFGLKLHSGTKGLQTWTTSDEFLMEEAKQYTNGRELHIFNKVRMYLKVATWSDIVQADCKNIDIEILFGRKSKSPSMSQQAYTWPNVDEPTAYERRIWTKILGLMYGVSGSNHRMPGATAIYYEEKDIAKSKWIVSPNKENIFCKEERGWTSYIKIDEGTRRTGPRYSIQQEVGEIPNGCKPITVTENQGYMCLQCEGKVLGEEWIEDQEDNRENWVLAHVQNTEQEKETFAQQIRRKEGVVVSDGSYKLGRSSAAFTTVPEKKIKGVTTIPGNKKDQSSYRGELGGLLAGITYTNKIISEKGITQGKCTAVCDNKGAIKAVFGGRDINPRWKCFDLLTLIRYQLEISPIKWEGLHVKGHQDDDTPYEELPVMAQANVDVDELAKEELRRNRDIADARVPGQIWRLYDEEGNQWISGDIEKEIRRVVYEKEMRAWWTKRIKTEISDVEWEEFKRLNRVVSDKDHFFAVKYGTGIMGTKLNIVRRKQGECSKCPCCDQEEDTDHILVCQSQVQKEKMRDEIKDLEDELANKTSWEIKEGLCEVIRALHEQRDPTMGGNWNEEVCTAVRNQYAKGQRALAMGFWGVEWTSLQTEYHKRTKSRIQGRTIVMQMKKEVRKLVKAIWLSRNEQLHHKEESEENKRKSADLDDRIRKILAARNRTNNRVFTQMDRQILYKHSEERLSRMKLRRKERWVKGAEDVLSRFEQSLQIGEVRIMMGHFHVHRDDG